LEFTKARVYKYAQFYIKKYIDNPQNRIIRTRIIGSVVQVIPPKTETKANESRYKCISVKFVVLTTVKIQVKTTKLHGVTTQKTSI